MIRRPLLSIAATALILGGVAALAAPIPSPTRAAVDLRVCGTVTAYVPATAVLSGAIVIGGLPLVIAADTDLDAQVTVGANLCLSVDLNSQGQLVDADVSANTTTVVSVCGAVSAYVAADADSTGVLTIGGRTFTIAVGTSLPASVRGGADLCVQLTLNGAAQVRGASVQANVTGSLRICGVVTALVAADADSTGVLEIGGRTLVLAAGSRLPASVRGGADLCLDLTLNGFGEVSDGTAQANLTSALTVCGQVNGYAAATPTGAGSLTIAGIPRAIAPGADVDGALTAGAFARVRLATDVFGRIADGTVLAGGATLADACAAAAQPPTPAPSDEPAPSASPVASGSANPSPSSTPDDDGDVAPAAAARQPAGLANHGGGQAGGGLLPDTASMARVLRTLAVSAVPLLAMLAGSAAYAIWRRRHAEEVAP